MTMLRRSLLQLAGLAATGLLARRADAQTAAAPDLASLMSERSFGDPKAPVTVAEFFSMTCSHCAAFSREVMPDITAKLITTGKLRFVYHDYPLDQIALTGAMVARALPPERYEPFVSALFASQDRWAFAPEDGNSTEALAKMAALAGLGRPEFDAVVADDAFKQAILTAQQQATDLYKINATPTFLCNGQSHSGELEYADFVKFTGVKV
jgi:protein-disulfide isomerase